MSKFSGNKDWNANKSDQIRAAVGRQFNLGQAATDNDVGEFIDDCLKKLVRKYESTDKHTAAEATINEI